MKIRFLIVVFMLLVSGVVQAQDSDGDTTNYETSPIYGNSSSRGVSVFEVPGQAAVGSTSVSRFARYSTGSSNFDPIVPVTSNNPLAYSSRLPMSGSGSVLQMPNQVMNKLSTKFKLNKMISMSSLLENSNLTAQNEDITSQKKNVGTRSIMDQMYDRDNFSSLRFPNGVSQIQFNKLLASSSSAKMFDKKKVLLLENRVGRLGYSRTDMSRSLLNRAGRVNVDKSKLSTEYSTSAILNR